MKSPRTHSVLAALGALALLVASAIPAAAQAQTPKISKPYDHRAVLDRIRRLLASRRKDG